MKEELFKKYVLEVCKVFDISEEDLFTKSKLSQFVDARYMLYYLCFARKIKMIFFSSSNSTVTCSETSSNSTVTCSETEFSIHVLLSMQIFCLSVHLPL